MFIARRAASSGAVDGSYNYSTPNGVKNLETNGNISPAVSDTQSSLQILAKLRSTRSSCWLCVLRRSSQYGPLIQAFQAQLFPHCLALSRTNVVRFWGELRPLDLPDLNSPLRTFGIASFIFRLILNEQFRE